MHLFNDVVSTLKTIFYRTKCEDIFNGEQDNIPQETVLGFINFVDRFTVLRFTAIGEPPAAGSIGVLLMNQYSSWPITFGL
jgi:hypothetical protein